MAEACFIHPSNEKTAENSGGRVELIALKSNVTTETNNTEVAINIDSSYAGKRSFKIICAGNFSLSWSKGVYIDDYISSDGKISGNPNNLPVIGAAYSVKRLNRINAGGEICLEIWNLAEQERLFSIYGKYYCRNADGAIVFWGAKSNSMDRALKYKDEIRKSAPDIPMVLLVDNVFQPPAKWVGEGLVMNSIEEMDDFCTEKGFFTWFEMLERATGEKSVLGQAMATLVNEIVYRISPKAMQPQVFGKLNLTRGDSTRSFVLEKKNE